MSFTARAYRADRKRNAPPEVEIEKMYADLDAFIAEQLRARASDGDASS